MDGARRNDRDRPYQRYSEAELLDLRRRIEEGSLKAAQRERDAYVRRNPHNLRSEGFWELEETVGRISDQISAINQELESRRRERPTDDVTVNCAHEGCFAIITLQRDHEQRLRQTHEMFCCVAGHPNYFPG
jgi:hypothetical protein